MDFSKEFDRLFKEELKTDNTISKNYEYMVPEAVNSCLYEMYKFFECITEDGDALECFGKIDAKNFYLMHLCFSELQEKYFNAYLTSQIVNNGGYILYLRDFFDKSTEYPHGSVIVNKDGSDFQNIYECSDLMSDIPTVTVVNPINGTFLYDFVNFNLHKGKKPVYIVYAGYDWLTTVEKLAKKAKAVVVDITLLSKGTKKELYLLESNDELLQKSYIYCRNTDVINELSSAAQKRLIKKFEDVSLNDSKNAPDSSEIIPVSSLWLTGKLRDECRGFLNEICNYFTDRHKQQKQLHGITLLLEQSVILISAIMLEDMELYYHALLSKLFIYIQFKRKHLKQLPLIKLCYVKDIIFLRKVLKCTDYENSVNGNIIFFNKLQLVISHPHKILIQIFLLYMNLSFLGTKSYIFRDLWG